MRRWVFHVLLLQEIAMCWACLDLVLYSVHNHEDQKKKKQTKVGKRRKR